MSPSKTPPIDESVRRWARRRLLAAAGLGWVALWALPAGAAASDPKAFVLDLRDRALAVLRRTDLDREAKIGALEDLLEEATDLDLIARLVMGRYWRQATPDQQKRYLELFRALLRRAIAERLDRYSGESFDVTDVQKVDDRDTIVRTLVQRPNGGAPYVVDWRLRDHDGRLLVIDVVAEGVSMLVTQRSEVAEIVGQKGIEGLLATMEERLKKQRSAG
ncbi:putative phospholipid-binding protein MlaC [bacterium HR40]|nr:putative phospholipid-binding protein MlaC [bacterium HR40]